MSDLTFVLIVLVAWVTIGLLSALWMARRGHRSAGWLFMGALFGPVLAITARERVEQHPRMPSRLGPGSRGPGTLRVLVGVDGSAASHQALKSAAELFGPSAEALVAAEVLDYDAVEDRGQKRVAAARRRLGKTARGVSERVTHCEVLVGPAAPALLEFAEKERMDIVVVGGQGRGLSRRLIGSVAQALVRERRVAVLVVGGNSDASDG